MRRLLKQKNSILVEENHILPVNFGKIQAKKDLQKFEENLFNDEENELELRPEFIKEMNNIDKNEKPFLVKNLDDLFE